MDRLEDSLNTMTNECYHLLSLVALFEGDFSIDWVVELTKKKASQILSTLEEGIQGGWLAQRSSGVFYFADLKKRQIWRDRTAADEKELLEHRIADLLLEAIPADDNKVSALIHYIPHISNNLERSRWLLKAGDFYIRTFRHEEALQCYLRILNDASGLDGEEADPLFIEAAIRFSKYSSCQCQDRLSQFIGNYIQSS